jgi:hypothetical protein
MRRASSIAVSAVLLPSVLALAACSASSAKTNTAATGGASAAGATAPGGVPAAGNVGLTSAQANAAINTAVGNATALHVKGSMGSGAQLVSMDIQFDKNSAQGTLVEGPTTIPFIAVNGTSYIEFTSSLLAAAGSETGQTSAAANQLLLNKWVPSTSSLGSSIASSFTPFLSLSAFTKQVTSNSDKLTSDGTTTIAGQAAANYKAVDTSQTPPVTEIISLMENGPALPIQVAGTGTEAGTMNFTWNQPTTITAPPAGDIYSGPGA